MGKVDKSQHDKNLFQHRDGHERESSINDSNNHKIFRGGQVTLGNGEVRNLSSLCLESNEAPEGNEVMK
jgi:hypothetical protein